MKKRLCMVFLIAGLILCQTPQLAIAAGAPDDRQTTAAVSEQTDKAAPEETVPAGKTEAAQDTDAADGSTDTVAAEEEEQPAHEKSYDSTGAGQPKAKDVYIDNTADNSISYVTGTVELTGSGGAQAGYSTEKEVYSNSAAVTYANPNTSQVKGMTDAAYDKVYNIANDIKKRGKSGDFHMSVDTSTGKVWDNRKYTTVEDGDAVLIGDSDYLTGAYGASDEYTRTHIASGEYGKETFYRVAAVGSVEGYDIKINKTGSGSVTPDMTSSLAEEKITVKLQAEDGWVLYSSGVFSVSDDHQIMATVYGDSGMTEDTLVFTMPYDDAEVAATFVRQESPEEQASYSDTDQDEEDEDGEDELIEDDDVSGSSSGGSGSSSTGSGSSSGTTSSPKTGDENGAALWCSILIGSLMAVIMMIRRRIAHR